MKHLCVSGIVGLTVLGLSSGALAQATPAHVIDETELYVRLWSSEAEGGYVVRVNGFVSGVGSHQDAIRVDVRNGSTTLASARCTFDEYDGPTARFACETDSGHSLTATGPLSIDLVYMDDVAETNTVIRTMNVNARAYPYWVRNDDRNRPVMGNMYQLDGSELLGTAFARMENPSLQQSATDDTQRVFLYSTFYGSPTGPSAVLRCRVGDVRIPDREISWRDNNEITVDERLSMDAEIRHVQWYRTRFEIANLWWGTRLPMPESGSGYDPSGLEFLGDHPGLWSCDVRSEGAVVRTFRFNVDAQGRIVAHAVEANTGAPPMPAGVHVVDVRIPSPSPLDGAVDPAAIRAGWNYGAPWGSSPAVTEMLGALPAASGSSAPTRGAAPAAGRARRGGH